VSSPRPGPSAAFRVLANPAYRIWAAADLLSVSGSWMQTVALNWLVYTMTGSTTMLGLTLTLSSLPSLALGLWGGALADRLDARRVLPVTQCVAGVLAAALAVLAAAGAVTVWHVWALAVAAGLVRVVEGPCLGRFGAQLLGPRDLPAGVALGSAIESTGRIAGMSLAGVLVAAYGPALVFGINAVTFFVAVAALARISGAKLHDLERSAAVRGGVREGLRYLGAKPELVVTFVLALLLGVFGRNFQVSMAAMADGPLDAGAAGYGLFSTAFAAGALAGALVAAWLRARTLRVLLLAGAGAALLQTAAGAAPTPLAFVLLLAPIAGFAVVLDSATAARVHLTSVGRMRGRVLAVHGLVGAGAGAIGGPLLGWACDTVGPRETLSGFGVVAAVACLVAAAGFARLRSVPLPHLVRRDPAPA
jgi:MFS family permease